MKRSLILSLAPFLFYFKQVSAMVSPANSSSATVSSATLSAGITAVLSVPKGANRFWSPEWELINDSQKTHIRQEMRLYTLVTSHVRPFVVPPASALARGGRHVEKYLDILSKQLWTNQYFDEAINDTLKRASEFAESEGLVDLLSPPGSPGAESIRPRFAYLLADPLRVLREKIKNLLNNSNNNLPSDVNAAEHLCAAIQRDVAAAAEGTELPAPREGNEKQVIRFKPSVYDKNAFNEGRKSPEDDLIGSAFIAGYHGQEHGCLLVLRVPKAKIPDLDFQNTRDHLVAETDKESEFILLTPEGGSSAVKRPYELFFLSVSPVSDALKIETTPMSIPMFRAMKAALDRYFWAPAKRVGFLARGVSADMYGNSGVARLHLGVPEAFGSPTESAKHLKIFAIDFANHSQCFQQQYRNWKSARYYQEMAPPDLLTQYRSLLTSDLGDTIAQFQEKLRGMYKPFIDNHILDNVMSNALNLFPEKPLDAKPVDVKSVDIVSDDVAARLKERTNTIEIRSLRALDSSDEYLALYTLLDKRMSYLNTLSALPKLESPGFHWPPSKAQVKANCQNYFKGTGLSYDNPLYQKIFSQKIE